MFQILHGATLPLRQPQGALTEPTVWEMLASVRGSQQLTSKSPSSQGL